MKEGRLMSGTTETFQLRSDEDVRRVLPLLEPRVKCVCRAGGLSAEDAADVLQDVAVILLLKARRPGGIDFPHGEAGLKNWAAKVAYRQRHRTWRRRGRAQ